MEKIDITRCLKKKSKTERISKRISKKYQKNYYKAKKSQYITINNDLIVF